MADPTKAALEAEASEVLALAVELARGAGGIQRERYETDLTIETKQGDIDLVTEVDRACEKLIVDGILAKRPGDAILAEEGGGCAAIDGDEWRWIIDPLDGTTNYAHGFPCFTVSIGVEYQGQTLVAAVYQPLLDEMYTALRGRGAFRNEAPIRVTEETELLRSLLVTGFPYDVHTSPDNNLAHFANFTKRARATRRDGSAAWDLCAVACGRFDGFWEFKLQPWDVAAGFLIVEEAGGVCTDAQGGAPRSDSFVASNGKIHAAMLEVLAESQG